MLLSGAVSACAPPAEAPPGTDAVFLISLDTLPASEIGCYGAPNVRTPEIDRLARQGVQARHGIAPAPRGMPQIEVAFDIDANGIVSVHAKDKGTGKEQKITIQASGGLSDEDIEKMVKDAEENAEADKERRELVEAKNQAESLINSTEKSMEEHSDKVDPTTIEAIELAIAALKDELETDNADKIKSGIQNVTEAAMKLGEAIYKAAQEEGEDEPMAADEAGAGDDDIVDADFEDLDDDKRA